MPRWASRTTSVTLHRPALARVGGGRGERQVPRVRGGGERGRCERGAGERTRGGLAEDAVNAGDRGRPGESSMREKACDGPSCLAVGWLR